MARLLVLFQEDQREELHPYPPITPFFLHTASFQNTTPFHNVQSWEYCEIRRNYNTPLS